MVAQLTYKWLGDALPHVPVCIWKALCLGVHPMPCHAWCCEGNKTQAWKEPALAVCVLWCLIAMKPRSCLMLVNMGSKRD